MKIVKDCEYELFRIDNQLRNSEKLPQEEFRLKRLKLIDEQRRAYFALN
jgi:hypothetical protein